MSSSLIENYNKVVYSLTEYFGCENFGWYSVNDETDCYWSVKDGIVSWAEKKKDFNSQDGKYYEEGYDRIFRGKETKKGSLTAVLIKYNRDYYWNIFNNSKEVK